MNKSNMTARDLLANGGKWLDLRWKDYIKMPDGSFWKPAVSIVQNDDVQMIIASA